MRPALRADAEAVGVRRGYSLVEVLAVTVILALLTAILLPAFQSARASARSVQCKNNLRQIGLALQNYLSNQGCFPGVDLPSIQASSLNAPSEHYYSPFTRMLAELEQLPLFNSVNFDLPPADGVAAAQNATVMRTQLALALCPSDSRSGASSFGRANYRFNLGPTHRWAPAPVFPGSFSGPFTVHYVYTPADFGDGLSNVVGVSERLQGDGSETQFQSGADYLLGSFPLEQVIFPDQALALCASLSPEGPHASSGGESWFLSGFNFTCYSHCATPNAAIADCALHTSTESLAQSLGARVRLEGVFKASSRHDNGVNCVLMDGSVKFVSNSIALSVWRALSTRSGGDAVGQGF